jgi:hypothetical protein
MLKKSIQVGIAAIVASIAIIACGGDTTPIDRTAANADADLFAAAVFDSVAASGGDLEITLSDIQATAPEGTITIKTIGLGTASISVANVVLVEGDYSGATITIPTANLVAASAIDPSEDLIIGFTSTLNGVESELYAIIIDDSDIGSELTAIAALKDDLANIATNATDLAIAITVGGGGTISADTVAGLTGLDSSTDIVGNTITETLSSDHALYALNVRTLALTISGQVFEIAVTTPSSAVTSGTGNVTFSGKLANTSYEVDFSITVAVTAS